MVSSSRRDILEGHVGASWGAASGVSQWREEGRVACGQREVELEYLPHYIKQYITLNCI